MNLAEAIEKITASALEIMAARATRSIPGKSYTAADIAQTVALDPEGETARYLAQLIAWGVEWFINFNRYPDLLAAFGKVA